MNISGIDGVKNFVGKETMLVTRIFFFSTILSKAISFRVVKSQYMYYHLQRFPIWATLKSCESIYLINGPGLSCYLDYISINE